MINNMMAIGDADQNLCAAGVKDNPPLYARRAAADAGDTVEFFNLIDGTKLTQQEKRTS